MPQRRTGLHQRAASVVRRLSELLELGGGSDPTDVPRHVLTDLAQLRERDLVPDQTPCASHVATLVQCPSGRPSSGFITRASEGVKVACAGSAAGNDIALAEVTARPRGGARGQRVRATRKSKPQDGMSAGGTQVRSVAQPNAEGCAEGNIWTERARPQGRARAREAFPEAAPFSSQLRASPPPRQGGVRVSYALR
jgi:hypothetical protein